MFNRILLALLVATSAVVPAQAVVQATLSRSFSVIAAAATGWSVRDMGMTPVTRDTVCNQMSQVNMTRLVSYVAQFHANYASDDVPLGDASDFNCKFGSGNSLLQPYDYMKKWALTMRAAGLHVLFRGNWNTWKVSNGVGSYAQPSLTYLTSPSVPYEGSGGLAAVLRGADTTSYIGKTYQWILRHADLFQDGDIFEPFGEPQNNGILDGPHGSTICQAPYCQFPTTAAFNKWLSDFSQADQAAFNAIGKKVTSGWFGLSGDSYTYVTPAAMAYSNTYNLDHFNPQCSFSLWQADVANSHAAMPNKPLALEFGDNCDSDTTPQRVAAVTDQYMGWLVQQSYVSGFEYWDESGQGPGAESAAVDYSTGQMTPAGQVVAKYFAMMAGGSAPSTPTNTPSAAPTSTPILPTATATSSTSPAAIRFLQSTVHMGEGSSLSSQFANSVRAGDLLVGVFRAEGSASVRDNLGDSWTQAGDCGAVSLWYAADARGGPTDVTVGSSSAGELRLALSEYSGAAQANPLMAVSCAQGSSATVAVASNTIAPSGALAVAGAGIGSNPITVTPGVIGNQAATLRAQESGSFGTIAFEDVTATAAGRQDATMTLKTAGGGWTAGVALFKPQ